MTELLIYFGSGSALVGVIVLLSIRYGKSLAEKKDAEKMAELIKENVKIKNHIEYTVRSGDLRELARLRDRWTK